MSATEGKHGDSHGHAAPEEPKTPMWLPALGAALFLVVGLVWGLSSPPKEASEGKAPAAASAAAGAADAGAAHPH